MTLRKHLRILAHGTSKYQNARVFNASNGHREMFLLSDFKVPLSHNRSDGRGPLFGRESIGEYLHMITEIYIDGTFKVVPQPFYQLVGRLRGAAHDRSPSVKSSVCYNILLNEVVERMVFISNFPGFIPQVVYLDYDQALIGAVRQAWPLATLGGCFYHLASIFRKHLSSLGLMPLYRTDAEFAQTARMVLALAFMPPHRLEQAFRWLREKLFDELQPVLDWFERYYLGQNLGDRRAAPLFPSEMWSVYDRVRHDRDTTNNRAEAMNRKIHRHFGVEHPSFWRFIELLRLLCNNLETEYEMFVAGGSPKNSRKVYRERRKRIPHIINSERDRTVEEILRGIASVYCDTGVDSQAGEAVVAGAIANVNGLDVEADE